MDWKAEDYPSGEGGGKTGWIWSKGVSLGKKFLAAGVVVSSAPFVVPPLVVVSTIAVISSVPYCLFLASYAGTQKLMNTLLPSSCYGSGSEENAGFEKGEYWFEKAAMEDDKNGRLDVDGEGMSGVDEAEAEPVMGIDEPAPGEADPVFIQVEGEEVTVTNAGEEPSFEVTNTFVAVYELPVVSENEEMEKEAKDSVESIRDEGRTHEAQGRTLEKAFQEEEKPIVSSDAKSENAGSGAEDLPEKKEADETRNGDEKGEVDQQKMDGHEGELESTVTETSTSTGKDEETTPNEQLDRAVDAPRGTAEEKRKNSSKKKRKTGRPGGGVQ